MRKTVTLVLVALLVIAVTPFNAMAGKKRKTVSEDWQVTAAPFPGADDHSDPATECGVDGVNFAIHSFKAPRRGTLETAITGFQGEWDLYVTDSSGNLVGSSVNFMAGPEERLTIDLAARAEVNIYACNFLGGPTADGALTFTYHV